MKQLLSRVQYEVRARLENFSGNSSISSADLFDEQKKTSGDFNDQLWMVSIVLKDIIQIFQTDDLIDISTTYLIGGQPYHEINLKDFTLQHRSQHLVVEIPCEVSLKVFEAFISFLVHDLS